MLSIEDYINSLIIFYNELSKYPLNKIQYIKGLRNTHILRLQFKSDVREMDYNLGFKIRKTCYVSGKLALENVKKLESLLVNEFSTLMIIPNFKRNRIIFNVYDIFGNLVHRCKIKTASVNLF